MVGDWAADEGQLRDELPHEPLPPELLPAVMAASERGWFLAPEAPMWCFLPAVWPSAQRAWVPDRSLRVVRVRREGAAETVIPFSAWDFEEQEEFINQVLVSAGVPPRPFGRLWLLRPPQRFRDLSAVVDALDAGVDAEGVPAWCCPELVAWTRTRIRTWFVTTS
ncbi:DUF5956 family protein [Jannaschia sp. R86511]|uniref:DUF5956 family protein n=1 Tax=Jannaschia sp. R86511 TaxID=3093853 RepID=UPI0036D31034